MLYSSVTFPVSKTKIKLTSMMITEKKEATLPKKRLVKKNSKSEVKTIFLRAKDGKVRVS